MARVFKLTRSHYLIRRERVSKHVRQRFLHVRCISFDGLQFSGLVLVFVEENADADPISLE